MTLRVGVFGAGGRMGSTVCQAVAGDPSLELVAAVDPFHEGLDLHSVTRSSGEDAVTLDLVVSGSPQALLDAEVSVAVDFTLSLIHI